jgi:hypothetical protein
VHLRREIHPPVDHFPCSLQAVDGLALQSSEDGTEGGEVLEVLTLLGMKTVGGMGETLAYSCLRPWG